jgi:uncharacterized protein (DUF58 family)
VRPARLLLAAAGGWFIFGIVAAVWPALVFAWGIVGVLLASSMLFDLFLLLRTPMLSATRHVLGSLPVGVWSQVQVRVNNLGRRAVRLAVFDHYPPQSETEGLPQQTRISGGGFAELNYRLRPIERGDHVFGQVQVLLDSPLRLWQRSRFIGAAQAVKVYPNFAAVAKYALFATDNRLSQIGIKKHRRRGEGLAFHQLREYRAGDALRQIDWKATSRLKRLISREYQDERDQQVVFLIDCGRRMLAKDDALSHFDHALNAVLLLSYVALRQGDGVGFFAFAGPQRFLPPRKGASAINAMLNSVYDLQPSTHAPDYALAATDLITRLKKRSLVVLITNLRDEDAEELRPAVALLRQQHLVVLASLQETALNQVAAQSVQNFNDALRLAATDIYLEQRRLAHQALKHYGVIMLDVEPAQLPVALVNRYLDIKRSGHL